MERQLRSAFYRGNRLAFAMELLRGYDQSLALKNGTIAEVEASGS